VGDFYTLVLRTFDREIGAKCHAARGSGEYADLCEDAAEVGLTVVCRTCGTISTRLCSWCFAEFVEGLGEREISCGFEGDGHEVVVMIEAMSLCL
jgi:hypothetical protein